MRRFYSSFVPRIKFPEYNIPLTDFKGHQQRAIHRFYELLPQLNLLLELRDSRAPVSTRNALFDALMVSNGAQQRLQRLVVYTKVDQCSPATLNRLRHWHTQMGDQFMALDCRHAGQVRNLTRILEHNYDAVAAGGSVGATALPLGYRMLAVGMPNVGKSTLLNTLRYVSNHAQGNRKVAKTGGQAGVTRKVSECVRIGNHRAGLFLYDAPGVSLPARVATRQRMLALSLCGCVKSNRVDPVIQADYLLYLLNLQAPESYTHLTGGKRTNDVNRVLAGIKRSHRIISDTGAAVYWLEKWRQTAPNTPRISFDIEPLLNDQEFDYRRLVDTERSLIDPWLRGRTDQTRSRNHHKAHNSNQLFGL
ncbi:LAMI_0G04566g1_1 [Lachancea mirantina]|uniref:LAMI_0G04566g1_1 n=1 Tax=Lachancea mirantina TaxID=1230905 RepID=A0A1G4K8I2_9SACH|nr:LAMI_0G04566g1_1 [Lachancea mirantina]